MTAEELDLLAKEIATLDECDPDYDAHLLHILNAVPAMIALAKWAERARVAMTIATEHCLACYGPGGRTANGLDTSIGCSHCNPLRSLLSAYPEGE